MLANATDGVNYFLKELRPRFIKGAANVFVGRLIRFMKLRRGRLDFQQWIARFELENQRLDQAWMDLLGDPFTNIYDPSFERFYTLLCNNGTFGTGV